jgi:hypothetical protein
LLNLLWKGIKLGVDYVMNGNCALNEPFIFAMEFLPLNIDEFVFDMPLVGEGKG